MPEERYKSIYDGSDIDNAVTDVGELKKSITELNTKIGETNNAAIKKITDLMFIADNAGEILRFINYSGTCIIDKSNNERCYIAYAYQKDGGWTAPVIIGKTESAIACTANGTAVPTNSFTTDSGETIYYTTGIPNGVANAYEIGGYNRFCLGRIVSYGDAAKQLYDIVKSFGYDI